MVGNKTLKNYNFNIYDYYQMCLDSKINGQHKQAIRQIKHLSKEQRVPFLEYVENTCPDVDLTEAIKHILIKL